MNGRTLHLGSGVTATLPPGARVTQITPRAHQVVWKSAGERRTFTVTFTDCGRAVTQWFRRAESWPLLLNKLRTTQGEPHIYIGGVATGEEAYSLAMMLEAARIPARIIATDVNAEVLAMAEHGVYSSESIEQALTSGVLQPETIASFLHEDGDKYRVTQALRRRVSFERVDLRTADLPSADVYILRNLWRHLGIAGAVHLAQQVACGLPPLGILSIGGADGLADIEARTDLDRVLRIASLRPVGISDLYFRTPR